MITVEIFLQFVEWCWILQMENTTLYTLCWFWNIWKTSMDWSTGMNLQQKTCLYKYFYFSLAFVFCVVLVIWCLCSVANFNRLYVHFVASFPFGTLFAFGWLCFLINLWLIKKNLLLLNILKGILGR